MSAQGASLSSFAPPSLSMGSRCVNPLLTSARGESLGGLSDLRIEIHLEMLVRGSIWASSMDLIPIGPSTLLRGHRRPQACDRESLSNQPTLVPIDAARRRSPCGGSMRVTFCRGPFPKGLGPQRRYFRYSSSTGSGLGFTPPLRFSESRVRKGVVFLRLKYVKLDSFYGMCVYFQEFLRILC